MSVAGARQARCWAKVSPGRRQHGKEGFRERQKTAVRALEQRQEQRVELCARRGLLHAGARGRPKERLARKPARFLWPIRKFSGQRRGRWHQKRPPARNRLDSFLSSGAAEDNLRNQRLVAGKRATRSRSAQS